MAVSLIEALTTSWEPKNYRDTYTERVEQLIEAKKKNREVVVPESTEETTGKVVDLLEALQASVDAAKGHKAGNTHNLAKLETRKADDDSRTEKKTTKKASKSSSKKSAATKKSSTKKSSAKKSATRRPQPGRPQPGRPRRRAPPRRVARDAGKRPDPSNALSPPGHEAGYAERSPVLPCSRVSRRASGGERARRVRRRSWLPSS